MIVWGDTPETGVFALTVPGVSPEIRVVARQASEDGGRFNLDVGGDAYAFLDHYEITIVLRAYADGYARALEDAR